jgi:hypothetical protein
VGDGEAVGVAVGLVVGVGLSLEVGLLLGLSLELGDFLGVGVPLPDLPGDGDCVAGADLVGVALGSGLGVTVGVALGVAVELGLSLLVRELGLEMAGLITLVRDATVTLSAAILAAVSWLGVVAGAVAGRVEHSAVTIWGWTPSVAAIASPNIPLLISKMPVRVPNVAILPGRCFTGQASALPPGCGLLWSPLLLTLCITGWTFPAVPIRHLRPHRCQWQEDDARQRLLRAARPGRFPRNHATSSAARGPGLMWSLAMAQVRIISLTCGFRRLTG